MHKDLDSLLREDLLQAPADFSHRVMQATKPLAMPFVQAVPRPAPGLQHLLQRFVVQLCVLGAGLLGLSQVLSFVFTAWIASSAL